MVGVTPGVDLLGPPLSFVFFGLPMIHKHLSNPMSRRGMKYVISGFNVINGSKDDIPPEQLAALTNRHDHLLEEAESLKTRGKTWRGSLTMNSDAHDFKADAKEFYLLAVAVSQQSQKDGIRNTKLSNPDSSPASGGAAPADPGTSPDTSQEQPTFHFRTAAERDAFIAATTDSTDASDSVACTTGHQQAVPKMHFAVLDPFEDDPAPESQPPSPLQPSYEHKEYHGYILLRSDSTVSFVSV